MTLDVNILRQSLTQLFSNPRRARFPEDAEELWAEAYHTYARSAEDVSTDVAQNLDVEKFREGVELIWNKPNTGDEALSDDSKTATRPGSADRGGGTASLKFESDGSIQVTDNATPNQKIRLDSTSKEITIEDANGNKITLGASGVKIEPAAGAIIDLGGGATEPTVKGTSWLQWAASHTHNTSIGPTLGPTPPPTNSLLTTVVKAK